MSAALDYGVQSFCFRHFKDNADVAQKVLDIGVEQHEVCAVHADFNDPEGWKDIVKTYSNDKGVDIVSIGVQTFTGQDSDRDFFECAAGWRKTYFLSLSARNLWQSPCSGARLVARIRHSRRYPLPTAATTLAASRACSTIWSVSARRKWGCALIRRGPCRSVRIRAIQ